MIEHLQGLLGLIALMIPKQPGDAVQSDSPLLLDEPPRSAMEAIAEGTREGVGLLVGVTAVAVALVSLVNMGLSALGGAFGLDLTLQKILGWIFAPLAFVIGIPWASKRSSMNFKLICKWRRYRKVRFRSARASS